MDVLDTRVPALQALARRVTGTPAAVLSELLGLVCEQLAMDVALVATVTADGRRVVRAAVRADGAALPGVVERSDPLAETWCGAAVEEGSVLVRDVADRPDLAALPVTAAFGIASYAGVPLHDRTGAVAGTLCAYARRAHATLNARDTAVLAGLGEVVAPLLAALDAPALPRPRTAPDLAAVADAVGGAEDVEQLTRPLLEALQELTGLASSYLTVVHEDDGVQEIRYARNTRPGFALPEGLHVPWEDTLCKRALDEGRSCTTDVPAVWGDSEAAAALGIQVYVSVPVALPDGRVWGTLCAADPARADGVEAHLATMRLFARLIAAQVERDAALATERAAASTDALTGCASRRVVAPWLDGALAACEGDDALLLLYVDVDRFKDVNDRHGHAAGDAVLVEVGRRLRAVARTGDLVARLGGDEFLLGARLPRAAAPAVEQRVREALDLVLDVAGAPLPVRCSVGAALGDGADRDALLAAADRAMYADKPAREASAR